MISANKEGVLSVTGYFAMQLIGMGIGRDVNQSLLYMKPEKLVKYMKTKEGLSKPITKNKN